MKFHLKILLCILLRLFTNFNPNVVSAGEVCKVVNMNAIPDFVELKQGTTFVDKRGLIKALFDYDSSRIVQLMTSPHKFGKTLNLKLLQRFVHVCWQNSDFRCASIFKQEPVVIYVSFKIILASTYKDIIKELGENIRKVFRSYESLYEKLCEKRGNDKNSKVTDKLKFMKKVYKGQMDKEDVAASLTELSTIIYKYNKSNEFLVLIDDYDSPVITAIEHNLNVEQVMNLTNNIFHQIFKVKHNYTLHGVIMGTLDVLDKKEFDFMKRFHFSDDNNRLARYFGFLESEVETLFKRHEINEDEINVVTQYYNGYTARNVTENIYSSFSIMSYLSSRRDGNKGKLNNYWAESNSIRNFLENLRKVKPYRDMLLNILEKKSFQFILKNYWSTSLLESMIKEIQQPSAIKSFKLNQDSSDSELSTNSDPVHLVLSYLYHHGFLTHAKEPSTYRVPNKEVKTYLRQLCEKSDES